MGSYRERIDQIKSQLDILTLVPEAAGGRRHNLHCPLPGHQDTHGSFSVYPETNSWTCWSHPTGRCGGSVLDFIMLDQGLDFRQAVQHAARLVGLDLAPPTEDEKRAEEVRHKREETLSILARYAHSQLLAETGLAQQARDYLEERGFGRDLLRAHLIGLLDLERLLQVRASHPILSEFSPEDFAAAGLRTDRGSLLFRGARLSFPLLSRQRTTGMTFRVLPGSEDPRKFVHLAGQSAGLWNLDALLHRERRVVLAEGVPDALTLAGWGVPALGNLGLEVAKNARHFAHLQEVTLVWDNDPAGRGRVLKAARAIQGALRDGEVRILHVPDQKDINDWARAGGTREVFDALRRGAPDLIGYQIEALPDVKAGGRLTREVQAELRELLGDLAGQEAPLQAVHLKAISRRLATPIKDLREMLKAQAAVARQTVVVETAPPEEPSAPSVLFVDEVPYHAALGFDFNQAPTANIGVWLKVAGGENLPQPFLVESVIRDGRPEVKLVPYAERSPGGKGRIRFPNEDLPHWSRGGEPYCIERLLADPAKSTPNAAELFLELRELMADHIWYPAGHEFDIVVLWILMTYFFPVFGTVGYLHFNGGSGSGKSLSLRFIHQLAFNAVKTANISDSALFRTSDTSRATLLMDEAEKLSFPKAGTIEAATRSIFLDSYTEGAVVYRMNMETGQVEAFDAFSPKCLGSINKIDPVLNNRCITIHCLKKEREIRLKDVAQNVQEFHARTRRARNKLHCLALTRFHEVHHIFTVELNGALPDLISREREIWLSLITMAHLVDRDAHWDETCNLVPRILQAQRDKEAEREEEARRENVDILILQTLLNLITGDDQRVYEVPGTAWLYLGTKLADGIHTELLEDGAWPFEKKLTSNRLTNLLKTHHVIAESALSRPLVGGKRVRALKIRHDDLRQALRRLHGLEAEEDRAVAPAAVLPVSQPDEPNDLPF